MKYCNQCGNELAKNAKVCPACRNPRNYSDTVRLMVHCKKCGKLLGDHDLFCPYCGEPCTAPEKREQKPVKNSTGKVGGGPYPLLTVLAAIGLFTILFLPIINCSSDWIDALSGGATTITFWDTMERLMKYGVEAIDDLDFWIALTASFSCAILLCGAANKSKGVCVGISALAALLMLFQFVLFQAAMSELYYFSKYFSLWLGFWIPLGVHIISFSCALGMRHS